jgi:hypothetical protein
MSGPSSRHQRSLYRLLAAARLYHAFFRLTLLFKLFEPCLRSGTGHFRLFGRVKAVCDVQRSSMNCTVDEKFLFEEIRLWLPMHSLYIPTISHVVEHPARVVGADTRRA